MRRNAFQILELQSGRLVPLLLISFAALITIPVHAQWEEVSIFPQYKFRKIFFLDDRGWLAAEENSKGILLYTDNGGDDWREVERFLGYITDFHFINAREGWLVVGWIWHTQDGGETWTDLSAQIDAAEVPWIQNTVAAWPNMIHFFDSNDGVAVFQARHPIGDASVIVATTQDGGRHWLPRKWEQFTTAVGSWEIVGDRIWIPRYSETWFSPDRGVSWEVLAMPTALWLIHFVDANNGWGIVYTTPPQRFSTQNGGKSWQFISEMPRQAAATEMLFVSDLEGWSLIFPFLDDRRHHAELWHTQDGGRQWQRVALPVDTRSDRSWARGLPADEFEAHLVLNPTRGDLWITLYDFSHPLLRGRNVHVVSVHPLGKLPTIWGRLKRTP